MFGIETHVWHNLPTFVLVAEATHPFVYREQRQDHPVLFHHRTPAFPKEKLVGGSFLEIAFYGND